MKFSIIIPCYNSSRYLPKLISSLVAQNHNHDDFEVIFIDDGSTDSTLSDLTSLSSQIKFSKVLGQKNSGVSAARNLGIRNARGEWLLFLDADDWYDEGYLTEFYHAISKYPKFGIFYSRIANFYERNKKTKIIRGSKPSNLIKKDDNGYLVFDLEVINSLFRTGAAIAVRRDIVINNNVWFPENIEYGEDFLFHFSYLNALKATCAQDDNLEYHSLYIPNVTYYYFKIKEERQREHDKFQNNLIYAETVKFEAAYDLLEDSNYDANQLAFHFKHLGVSVVYALNLSNNLKDFDEDTRNDLYRYLSILKRWLLLIRDLGLTLQFLEELKKEKFFTMTRSLPFALFLSTLACNPCKIEESLDFVKGLYSSDLDKKIEESSLVDDIKEDKAIKEEITPSLKKSLKDKFLSIFTNKNNKQAQDRLETDVASSIDGEAIKTTNPQDIKDEDIDSKRLEFIEQRKTQKEEEIQYSAISQFTQVRMNHAPDLDFLYYNTLYIGNKKHLIIVTNKEKSFLDLLESFKVNVKNLSRNIAYRLCGLELGREFIINLSLLNKKEQIELHSFCENISKNNFFDYRRGKVFSNLALLLTGRKKHKNYILYKDTKDKELLTAVSHLFRDPEDNDKTFMLNSYDLGYPFKNKFIAAKYFKDLLSKIEDSDLSSDYSQGFELTVEEKESLAKFSRANTSSHSHQETREQKSFDAEVEAEANSRSITTVKLNNILASYHIRGFIPADYNCNFKAINIPNLVGKKSGLKGLVKYYMDFANSNCLLMTLSQLAKRQDCCFNIFTREFPLFDLLVVVDCEVSDYMLTTLRSYPNFRLVFPDMDVYKLWLERLILKSASKVDLANGNLDFALYKYNFDLWQILIRSFVIIDKRKL